MSRVAAVGAENLVPHLAAERSASGDVGVLALEAEGLTGLADGGAYFPVDGGHSLTHFRDVGNEVVVGAACQGSGGNGSRKGCRNIEFHMHFCL